MCESISIDQVTLKDEESFQESLRSPDFGIPQHRNENAEDFGRPHAFEIDSNVHPDPVPSSWFNSQIEAVNFEALCVQ
jgi:hypothetical protein